MCITLVPPPLSHKFSNEEKKKLISMQYQHTIQLICNIKSINLVGNSLLSVNTARLLKGASYPLPYPWVVLPCYHFCMCIFM